MSGLQPQVRKLLLHINVYTHTYALSSQFSAINFPIPIGPQPSPSRLPSHSARFRSDPQPQHANTRRSIPPRHRAQRPAMKRLVRFRSFLNEELWIGTDDMRAHRCGSQVRRREGSLGVGVAEECARCEGGGDRSMGERVSYRMYWFSEWVSVTK